MECWGVEALGATKVEVKVDFQIVDNHVSGEYMAKVKNWKGNYN